jgi:cholesterol transport system auxiliary component
MKKMLSMASLRIAAAALLVSLTAGCGSLFPTATPQPVFYSLDAARGETTKAVRIPPTATSTAPTLIVSPAHAAAGYDSPRILYMREDHKIEYFAHSEWIDTPARMITSLTVTATENSGAFRAVVLTPTSAVGDIRLDVEVARLHQIFGGGASRVRFTMRAYMVDYATRKVLASREFDETVLATSEDPQGGVVAANRAVQIVMGQLAIFCAEGAAQWPVSSTSAPRRAQQVPTGSATTIPRRR